MVYFMGQGNIGLSMFLCFKNAGKEEKLLKWLICTDTNKRNSIIALVF